MPRELIESSRGEKTPLVSLFYYLLTYYCRVCSVEFLKEPSGALQQFRGCLTGKLPCPPPCPALGLIDNYLCADISSPCLFIIPMNQICMNSVLRISIPQPTLRNCFDSPHPAQQRACRTLRWRICLESSNRSIPQH